MGKIKKILENELVGGTQSTDVYPITSTKAVYDTANKLLDDYIKHLNNTYTFKGVATPTLTPASTDEPIFYIALSKGAYTKFGDIELDSDEVAIIKYNNGKWIKDTLNIAKMDILNKSDSSLKNQQSLAGTKLGIIPSKLTWEVGTIINGAANTNSSYLHSNFIPVKEGGHYTVCVSTGNTNRPISGYGNDTEDSYISSAFSDIRYSVGEANTIDIVIPNGVNYIRIIQVPEYPGDYGVFLFEGGVLQDISTKIEESSEFTKGLVKEMEIYSNDTIDSIALEISNLGNEIHSSRYKATDYIKASAGDIIYIKSSGDPSIGGIVYDSNKVPIDALYRNNIDSIVTILPENAAYFRASGLKDKSFVVKKDSVVSAFKKENSKTLQNYAQKIDIYGNTLSNVLTGVGSVQIKWSDGVLNSDGSTNLTTTGKISNFIPVKGGDMYLVGYSSKANISSVAFYSENSESSYIEYNYTSNRSGYNIDYIIIPTGANFMRICYYLSNKDDGAFGATVIDSKRGIIKDINGQNYLIGSYIGYEPIDIKWLFGVLKTDGTATYSGSRYISNFIKVNEGEEYLLGLSTGNYIANFPLAGYSIDSEEGFISGAFSNVNIQSAVAQYKKVTIPNGVNYIRISYNAECPGYYGAIKLNTGGELKKIKSINEGLKQESTDRKSEIARLERLINESSTDIGEGSITWGMLSEEVKQAVGSGGNITNSPDGEFITTTSDNRLTFADKKYSPSSYSGLGRKYLRKNIVNGVNTLTDSLFENLQNTIFIIQYDYIIPEGSTVNLPKNSILKFEGGSIRGGILKGSYTEIDAGIFSIFSNITLSGIWKNTYCYAAWFGAVGDGTTDDRLSIQNALDSPFLEIILHKGSFSIGSYTDISRFIAIVVPRYKSLVGTCRGTRIVAKKGKQIENMIAVNDYCTIKNFTIASSYDNTESGEPINFNIINAVISNPDFCPYLRVENINILCVSGYGFNVPSYIAELNFCTVNYANIGFKIGGAVRDGEIINGTSTMLRNCYCQNIKKNAYYIYHLSYAIIEQCAADSCGFYKYSQDVIQNKLYYPIYLIEGSRSVALKSCGSEGCGQIAHIKDSHEISIEGCILTSNPEMNNSSDWLYKFEKSSFCKISDTVVTNTKLQEIINADYETSNIVLFNNCNTSYNTITTSNTSGNTKAFKVI